MTDRPTEENGNGGSHVPEGEVVRYAPRRPGPPPSRARMRIVKALEGRQATAPELARRLRLDRAGVYRRLEALVREGYVEKEVSHRPWVYYRLTDRGRALVR